MKKLLIAVVAAGFISLIAGSGAPAQAADLTVKITSFRQIDPMNPNNRAAELCGVVSGAEKAALVAVRILADPNHDPGTYNTLADSNGAFCSVIVANTGQASATASVAGRTSATVIAQVK